MEIAILGLGGFWGPERKCSKILHSVNETTGGLTGGRPRTHFQTCKFGHP